MNQYHSIIIIPPSGRSMRLFSSSSYFPYLLFSHRVCSLIKYTISTLHLMWFLLCQSVTSYTSGFVLYKKRKMFPVTKDESQQYRGRAGLPSTGIRGRAGRPKAQRPRPFFRILEHNAASMTFIQWRAFTHAYTSFITAHFQNLLVMVRSIWNKGVILLAFFCLHRNVPSWQTANWQSNLLFMAGHPCSL